MRVGFNSGVLRKCGVSLLDTIKFVKKINTNSFELCFPDPNSLLNFEATKEVIDILNSFNHLSIHAPFRNVVYRNDESTRKIILKLKELNNILNVEGIVFHPSDVKDFAYLDRINLPILVENMDFRKNSFKTEGEITELKEKYGFGFVLDVEHAFENDPSMELCKKFIKVMGDRLKEVHLSGSKKSLGINDNNHCFLVESEFGYDILKAMKEIADVPIILEASAEENQEGILEDELKYIRDIIGENHEN